MGKNRQDKGVDRLSEQQMSKAVIFACGFGLCRLLEVILYRLVFLGGILAIYCPVSTSQRFQMYYFYRKSNWRHKFCPLYRGCLPFGESVARYFTVLEYVIMNTPKYLLLSSRIISDIFSQVMSCHCDGHWVLRPL